MTRRRKRKNNKFPKKATALIVGFLAIAVVALIINARSAEAKTQKNHQQQEIEFTTPDDITESTPVKEPSMVETLNLCDVKIPKGTVSEIIDYPGFRMSFNADAHQPNWVAWELTRDEATTNVVGKRKNNFAPDPNVKGCATLADYKSSGYDRGHMAPAADMKWSAEASDACFLLTNMSPQRNQLNSGAWSKLEDKCRNIAIRDSAVVIICGPILTDRLKKKIGETGVLVPERYFKVILSPYTTPMQGMGFIMPNALVDGGMQATAVSIDEVEAITGFDFFSGLADDIENEVEAQNNFTRWSRK